jgi:Peptidase S46
MRFSMAQGLWILSMGLAVLALIPMAHGDEGMWVFNKLPLAQFKARYGFEPPAGWADHLRSSAVRFNSGGSGSFVSPDGLVMTNHHVGADTLAKLSTSEKNYHHDGFYARRYEDEVKAPDLELNVLVAIEDVTEQVNRQVGSDMDDARAGEVRRQAMARIEKEATDKNGLRNDVITLYQGGQYHLYSYKKYTDVRLVFAPEFDIAFFGGDPDNFEYPRYDLDVCFFRAYEDGKPARVEHFLEWSPDGSKEGELVFVAGHPGHTDRLNTVASLEHLRDVRFPFLLDFLKKKEALLLAFGHTSPEADRQSREELFSVQNSRKARVGGLEGLRDEAFMKRKAQNEADLLARIRAAGKPGDPREAALHRIAEAQKTAARILKPWSYLERGWAFDSTLFDVARKLVRLAEESTKPNAERLKEYRESGIKSLELELFSPAPTYPEFEEIKLAHSLKEWKQDMPADPLVARVLHGRTPAEAARDFVRGTKLADVEFRRKLADGGMKAILASDDPMIKLALAVDAEARAVRKIQEDQVEGVETANYAIIARDLFEAKGDAVYPDATFTLRLAFGVVKGYEVDGKAIPPYTTTGGAFEHAKAHGNTPPYELPRSWIQAKESGSLRLETPFNFVSTADIIGGNSGSPVVNRQNQVVGLIFDGNIQSLVLDFGYDERQARAVAVDSRSIMESLRSIYHADRLVDELTANAKR